MSLRRRLLLVLLTTVIAALAIVGVSTYVLVARSQLAQVDDDLDRVAVSVEATVADESAELLDVRDTAPGFYAELREADGDTIWIVPLRDRDGDLLDLANRDDVPVPAAAGDEPIFATITVEEDEVLRTRTIVRDDGSVLVVGRSMEDLLHTRRQLLIVLLLTGGAAVVAATALGAWLVGVGLRPLDDVERAAALVDDDLTRRVPASHPSTEVGHLASTINHMLDRLEDAFRQRERDLAAVQESEARMRRFVADASHELRTPIAATAAYAELFERGARDRPEDLARAMSGIRNETARMADLVEDLLLLARLDEGRPIEHGEVDLCEIVADAVDASHAVAPERPVSLRLDDVAIVEGDHGRLRQVVDNLLGNVRTHTPPGTACEVTVSVDGGDAVLTVRDDGPGMSAIDAERAFDRFHRADSSRTRASGGSGLGLAIVVALVDAHQGTVSLDSSPGAGTTITIRIPLATARRGTDDDSTTASTTASTHRDVGAAAATTDHPVGDGIAVHDDEELSS